MNILFVSLSKFSSVNESGIYTDLLRQFTKIGHKVYILSPIEKKDNYTRDTIIKEKNSEIIKVYTGNIQKTNSIEKGINTILLSSRYIAAIKKYLKEVKFDLVLYPTPPVTLYNVIKYVKERDNAKTYLMLKDIFPQNAIDLGILSKNGLKGIAYKYFRNQEKKFYNVSDTIGCMSKANVNYLLKHNGYIPSNKVEVFPNCIEVKDKRIDKYEKDNIRLHYNIPTDKIVFVYGGNLGKPQGIPFIIQCLDKIKYNKSVFFLLIGSGTEVKEIKKFIEDNECENIRFIGHVPKEEYNLIISSCDIGLIFLDYRFTIPNFPSRLLSYMQVGLPILSVTDRSTDIGDIIEKEKIGWSIFSNDEIRFKEKIYEISKQNLLEKSERSFKYLYYNYNTKFNFNKILEKIRK